MFRSRPSCRRCGYEGLPFEFIPHDIRDFSVLVQDKQSLGLRIVMIAIKEEELPEFDMDRDYQQLWTKRMAEIAGPHLTASERVVSFREFAWAAMQKKTTPSELPCPNCRAPLHWHLLEGSEE